MDCSLLRLFPLGRGRSDAEGGGAVEGECPSPLVTNPHPALRADLSQNGRGEGRAFQLSRIAVSTIIATTRADASLLAPAPRHCSGPGVGDAPGRDLIFLALASAERTFVHPVILRSRSTARVPAFCFLRLIWRL